MTEIRQRASTGLKEGDSFQITRTFTDKDIDAFAEITFDYNPVHFDKSFIEAKGFKKPVCHGLLVGGMITEIGGQIGWLASGLDFRFLKPVYTGDTVTCKFTIHRIKDNGRAEASAVFINQSGETVLKSNLKGILPNKKEKSILGNILKEPNLKKG